MLTVLERILAMPARHDLKVAPEQVDINGHFSVPHYLFTGSESTWFLLQECGADDDYIQSADGGSFFTIETHARYLSELRLGDRYTTHAVLLDRTDKAVHVLGFLVDGMNDRLAAVVETIYVHVSMQTRRAASIPADICEALDACLTAQGDLAWLADFRTRGANLRH